MGFYIKLCRTPFLELFKSACLLGENNNMDHLLEQSVYVVSRVFVGGQKTVYVDGIRGAST